MKRLKFPAALLAAACILLCPAAAVSGARAAMAQWAFSVAPALFPFLALLPSLTGREACTAYGRIFALPMRLLRLPENAAPAVIIGMIAGSPGGAIALVNVASHGEITRAQCMRIALALCGVSPGYLILGVGQGLCGDAGVGLRLAGMQLLVQITLLILLRPMADGEAVSSIKGVQIRPGIPAAVETVLGVCGYMVFFSAVTAVAGRFMGESAAALLLPVMDLPSGLPGIVVNHTALLCAGIGFAGLCIAAQNLDALRPIGLKPAIYLGVRCMAALMMAALSVLCLPHVSFTGKRLPPARMIYALSLLAGCGALIPVLNSVSSKLFLYKRKLQPSSTEEG